ncbi:MAG: YaaR family protein [Treponema sp.]|nr:YaaR family protein [Treponema sp.]
MSEINPLGASSYYSGVLNASGQAAKEAKKEKVNSKNKLSFANLLKTQTDQTRLEMEGFPPEIADMPVEEAAIFLKDLVDEAGNAVSVSPTTENLNNFKKNVQQFIKYIVKNNYEVTAKRKINRWGHPEMTDAVNYFSTYALPPHAKNPKVTIQVINQKLDALTREMLTTKVNKEALKILDSVNEIKGLIVDLLQS